MRMLDCALLGCLPRWVSAPVRNHVLRCWVGGTAARGAANTRGWRCLVCFEFVRCRGLPIRQGQSELTCPRTLVGRSVSMRFDREWIDRCSIALPTFPIAQLPAISSCFVELLIVGKNSPEPNSNVHRPIVIQRHLLSDLESRKSRGTRRGRAPTTRE
jgi:hypothetical protein